MPAERLGVEQMDALERYVRDLGGGFMFAGGAQSFGLGGYQGTRIESLLPVWMDSERRRDEHSLALALVIDCSGSMSGQKIELAKDAAKATAELLGPDDSLGVVGFSGEPERVVRLQSAQEPPAHRAEHRAPDARRAAPRSSPRSTWPSRTCSRSARA